MKWFKVSQVIIYHTNRLYSLWSIQSYVATRFEEIKESTEKLTEDFMKLVFIKDKKIFERKFDEFFTAHKNNKTMQEVHEELSQITRKFA